MARGLSPCRRRHRGGGLPAGLPAARRERRLQVMTRIRPLLLLCLLLPAPAQPAAADPFDDDHGDEPAAATPLAADGQPVQGVIGIDIDEDWFRFTALPGIRYHVEVTGDTIWDTSLELRAPDGLTLFAATNSAASPAPPLAVITNDHGGGACACFVGVGGYLAFTTGAYTVAVQPLNDADTDKDGLPDAWETAHLDTLAWDGADDPDGDGSGNLAEYYAMTDPGTNTSVFAITSISNAPAATTIAWPAAPWAAYRIRRADNVTTPAWTTIGTNMNWTHTALTAQWVDAAPPATASMYRVELILGD
jgi:hypothetical protein